MKQYGLLLLLLITQVNYGFFKEPISHKISRILKRLFENKEQNTTFSIANNQKNTDSKTLSDESNVQQINPHPFRATTWSEAWGLKKLLYKMSLEDLQKIITSENINDQDYDGETLLHYAVDYRIKVNLEKRMKIISFLIKSGIDINTQSSGGWSPLHISSSFSYEITKYLLKHGADANVHSDNYGSTPLHIAAMESKSNIVKILVDEYGADVNSIDNNGHTPLFEIISSRNINMEDDIKFLVSRGADINLKDKWGGTVLEKACEYQRYEVINLLLKQGADPKISNKNGFKPIHFIQNYESLDACIAYYPEMINEKTVTGETLLDIQERVLEHFTQQSQATREKFVIYKVQPEVMAERAKEKILELRPFIEYLKSKGAKRGSEI